MQHDVKMQELLLELSNSLTKAGELIKLFATGEVKEEKTEEKKEKKGKKKETDETKNENKTEPPTPPPSEDKEEKSFSIKKTPKADEVVTWKKQWEKLSAAQQQEYLAGKIDSLGNKIAAEETKAPANESKYDASYIRAKLKAVSEKAGSKDKGYEFLRKFGAGKLDEVKTTDYPALVEAMDEFLNSSSHNAGDNW